MVGLALEAKFLTDIYSFLDIDLDQLLPKTDPWTTGYNTNWYFVFRALEWFRNPWTRPLYLFTTTIWLFVCHVKLPHEINTCIYFTGLNNFIWKWFPRFDCYSLSFSIRHLKWLLNDNIEEKIHVWTWKSEKNYKFFLTHISF